jgi:hypothetical protein
VEHHTIGLKAHLLTHLDLTKGNDPVTQVG